MSGISPSLMVFFGEVELKIKPKLIFLLKKYPLREGEGGHVVRIDLHVGGTCRTSIGGLSFLFSPNLTYLEQRKLGLYQTHKVISSSMNSSLALP